MDKALVFGSKDCRFESCQGQSFDSSTIAQRHCNGIHDDKSIAARELASWQNLWNNARSPEQKQMPAMLAVEIQANAAWANRAAQ